MSDTVRLQIGDVRLTRVRYFDIPLDPDAVSLTAEQVAGAPNATPVWATDDGQVRVGVALWVIEAGGRTIVVDPCCTADAFIRNGPEAIDHQNAVLAAMADAGFLADRVDTVFLTHLDGIGMAAAATGDGGWAPLFPNARVVFTSAELDFLAASDPAPDIDALRALLRQGFVDGVAGAHQLAPGVAVELTAAHSPGHAVVRIASGGEQAVMIGHLAVSPIHLAIGRCEALHRDPDAALAALETLVAEAEAEGIILIGPLWPTPGAARVGAGGEVVPISAD